MGIFFGSGQAMSPAITPGGSVHCSSVGMPESPAFFQYVCHSGACVICRPTHTGCLAAASGVWPTGTPCGAWASSLACTWSVRTTSD